jgi:hypothetical protein
MRNIILYLFILFTFGACQYFEKKVPQKEALLDKELDKINWYEVDEFPNVLQCDSLTDKSLRKACFFNFMSQTVQEKLSPDSIKVLYPKSDTLQIKVTISPEAVLHFESLSTPDKPKIDSLLKLHLSNFPKVEPAIKRGIKVTSQFILPVVFRKKV